MTDGSGPAARLAAAIARRGASLVLRGITRTTGPQPLVNPPDLDGLVVDGDTVAGATVMALRAVNARGILLAGDRLSIARTVVVLTANASARPDSADVPGFDAVAVAPLPAALPDGAAVAGFFQADMAVHGIIGSYPTNLVDGIRIQAQDLTIQISAFGIPRPQNTWRVLFDGRALSIISVRPTYERGDIISYTIQAR